MIVSSFVHSKDLNLLYNVGPGQASNFTCAEPKVKEQNLLYQLISLGFATWAGSLMVDPDLRKP